MGIEAAVGAELLGDVFAGDAILSTAADWGLGELAGADFITGGLTADAAGLYGGVDIAGAGLSADAFAMQGAENFWSDPFATTEGVNSGWNPVTGYGLDSGYSSGALNSLGNLGWGDVKSFAKDVAPFSSMYSGMKALSLADQQRKLAQRAGQRADPWGTSGGRAQADAQLQQLNRDPSAAMAGDPRYAAMVQAAQRATAIHGQDSGAMAAAGAQAGGNWYTQRMAELSGLAGANANPAAGVSVEMAGLTNSNDLYSKGLASIGYGMQRFGGADMPPEVLAWMKSKGMA